MLSRLRQRQTRAATIARLPEAAAWARPVSRPRFAHQLSKEKRIVSDPVLYVTNHSTRDVFIAGDPNWDDQVLMVNGERTKGVQRLAPEQSATVSVQWGPHENGEEHMMGVIFADGRQYDYGPAGAYQMSIGQHAETGLLGVTDEHVIKRPAFEYATTNPTPWSMDVEFVDARVSESPRNLAF
jgi:hypothetical protein